MTIYASRYLFYEAFFAYTCFKNGEVQVEQALREDREEITRITLHRQKKHASRLQML